MQPNRLEDLRNHLRALGNETIARHSRRFFQTGSGQYGEGDLFLGVRVPQLRRLAKQHGGMALEQVSQLLSSAFHEERLLALLMLVTRFQRAGAADQRKIYRLYLDRSDRVNNWDLVDTTAPHILGAYLNDRSRQPLYRLARSENLWERRMAIIATFHFIRKHDFFDALRLSDGLINDAEDLIHKAVGWMLREIGKRDLKTETDFLKPHYRGMPRTMLRYAIEKFPPDQREAYLKGTVIAKAPKTSG